MRLKQYITVSFIEYPTKLFNNAGTEQQHSFHYDDGKFVN